MDYICCNVTLIQLNAKKIFAKDEAASDLSGSSNNSDDDDSQPQFESSDSGAI